MPISRCLHDSRKAVVLTFSPPYSLEDWRAAMSTTIASPEFQSCHRLLINRAVAPAPTTEFIDSLVLGFRQFARDLAHSRVAILVGDTASFGMARMLSIKLEMQQAEPSVAVFRDEQQALDWLIAA